MPLFMDFHKGLRISVEDVKNAHIADEAVQSKYGVIYHQFWVNEEEGTVFCLIEGPNKEACAAVHREAHGNVACSIVEVSEGFYELFMGRARRVDQGLVRKTDGTPDTGVRGMLAIDIQAATTISRPSEFHSLKPPHLAREVALSLLTQYHGREVSRLQDDLVVGVFDSPVNAVRCGLRIQKEFLARKSRHENDPWSILFKMGLSAGHPVTEKGDFFSETTLLARRLCSVADVDALLIAARMRDYCNVKELIRVSSDGSRVRILAPREEDFISSLFSISEEKLSDEKFTVDALCRKIGMSRPQLYRKTTSLTGKSPNDFLRDLRMDKALSLIKKKAGNISEIALEVGYNNPSYFAKCFQGRFGCVPSRYEDN